MDKKTIWIICHYATPLKYGHGARHFLLAEEFIRNGYAVKVFASTSNFQLDKMPELKGVFTHENVNGVEVVWVRGIRYSNPAGMLRIISWFIFSLALFFYRPKGRSYPGIVIVSSLSLIPVINGIWIKVLSPRTQFIFEIRDIWPQTLVDIGGYSKYNPLVVFLGLFEKAGYRKADNIVATMPKADIHIRNRIKKNFNFTCIPQGIHPEKPDGIVSPCSNDFDKLIPESGFIVGYAGAIGVSNCLETLIVAARIIKERGLDNISFVFLGDGNAKAKLAEMASDMPNVIFIPKVPKDLVRHFLKKCSVVYDSVRQVPIYNFGLSRNKWMDYMVGGKPLIVSYSGYVSLINEAGCGTVVPAGDSLALADCIIEYSRLSVSVLKNIGENGRDYVLKNRTFEALAAKYRDIFIY